MTGQCQRSRYIDDVLQACGRTYEYTSQQASVLRANGEKLLCLPCAGEYLAREGERKQREEAWAMRLLAELSPTRRPTASEVKQLHTYGFDRQLRVRLVEIDAFSRRDH